jgi:hypothetical protein
MNVRVSGQAKKTLTKFTSHLISIASVSHISSVVFATIYPFTSPFSIRCVMNLKTRHNTRLLQWQGLWLGGRGWFHGLWLYGLE